ncbi:MAG: hypothetical protein ACRD2C_12100 [Acidimicrobiales bacterium]
MGRPTDDRFSFPTTLAEDLAVELERVASKLEEANTARAQARDNMPDFQCTAAHDYRETLKGHLEQVTDTVERFRRTAGSLRDAIADHEDASAVVLPMP